MSTTGIDDERLEDLTPSTKLVYVVLDHHDNPMTQSEIADATMLSPRSVGRALRQLQDVGVITSETNWSDLRETLYVISRSSGK